jgi:glycosyltransferase involved in cell wall biosynthesis
MKVALVHDYLIDYGGAEVVLAALHEMYPAAPIYVSILDKGAMGKLFSKFKDATIITSWFNNLPFASKLISPLRFLIPFIWDSFDFSGYDVVITSASWAVTKGMRKGKETLEICYLHTPPRYLYGYDTSRRWKARWFGGLVNAYSLIVNHVMRLYDFNRAQEVDYFIANSENVGKRIEKFYRRVDYHVIYPPVETVEIIEAKTKEGKDDYFLAGGRMVASKNFDLIIRACKEAGVPLKVFGDGIEKENLKKLAKGAVDFLGRVSDTELVFFYKGARAFILAQKDEDFGITSIEAAAAGCPVIAYKGGGYLETVIDGKTGVFFNEPTVESLASAIRKFEKMKFSSEDCVNQAKKFSKERFIREINSFVLNHT